MAKGHTRVGILGFSFKAGTDDLRESAIIEVIERLIGKGYDLRIYDRNGQLATLVASNRDFVLNPTPSRRATHRGFGSDRELRYDKRTL